ncbi:hypothetical protein PYH37_004927 [Sinorhizobium numidicum]|uniref:J domain-containing protein n=1 Tax=Sinorhizobium numidicum TaxID=680248 RepID=A0ABY8CYS6_9HYPH|nr:hypothetical protein [Sinorhizobium numidicum]WEX76611.1 hypothetical protein PYH37_004927 [Sinorhizobium numidicum]WEX83272.1 hypothetical protein PYH38_005639 [Sinorhizobium numidicum]
MFGMSVFQSVLERLNAERDIEELDDHSGSRLAGVNLAAGFVASTSPEATAAFGTVDRAYRELASVDRAAPLAMPDYLRRTSLAEVAGELALSGQENSLTLAAKRRRFAAANHPDRLPAEFRANATVRMKLANMLIDEAARRLPRDGRSK